MKKIIATIAASVLSVAAMAQKPGDGVLRIHTVSYTHLTLPTTSRV